MDRVIDNEQVIYERTRHYLPGDWKLFLATTLNLTFFLFTDYIVSSFFRFYIGISLLNFVRFMEQRISKLLRFAVPELIFWLILGF